MRDGMIMQTEWVETGGGEQKGKRIRGRTTDAAKRIPEAGVSSSDS
jgi:hypothetical protein